MLYKLQYISQGKNADEQLENIERVLDAGGKWIQLRCKNWSKTELIALAEKVKTLCSNYHAILIINDDVEIAQKIDADGVHLGLEDIPVQEARNLLGNDKIIGGTANTLQDVIRRIDERCDYIGLGPYRYTITKQKLSPVLGIQGYTNVMQELKKRNLNAPVYAIGGITIDDVHWLMQTGIYGIAVSGALSGYKDILTILQKFNEKLYEKIGDC